MNKIINLGRSENSIRVQLSENNHQSTFCKDEEIYRNFFLKHATGREKQKIENRNVSLILSPPHTFTEIQFEGVLKIMWFSSLLITIEISSCAFRASTMKMSFFSIANITFTLEAILG